MIPKKTLITINDNKEKIEKLLMELVLQPRLKALEWSKITKQTPNMKPNLNSIYKRQVIAKAVKNCYPIA